MIFARPNQLLETHLNGVASLCEKYSIIHKKFCYYSGLFHDIGKSSVVWQEYLQNSINNIKKGKISHADPSAIWIYNEVKKTGIPWNKTLEILCILVKSHHTKSLNFENSDFKTQSPNPIFSDIISFDFEEIQNPLKDIKYSLFDKLLIRYLFSILVDSDITDCQIFSGLNIPNYNGFDVIHDSFNKYISKFDKTSLLNKARSEIFESCSNVDNSVGIYTLNVPTGGGKTLSSFNFAIRKAKATNSKRIIYVLPYTTLMTQTSNVFRKFSPEFSNVVEVHSMVDSDDKDKYNKYGNVYNYICDTFDGEIIVTSHVAFLDSVYGRKFRRFHNLSESIIVFDEVQSFGICNLKLLVEACRFLETMNTTSILSTATQIDYSKLYLDNPPNIKNIVDCSKYNDVFKRVTYCFDFDSEKTYTELTQYIHEKSTLIITNSKKQCLNAYKVLSEIYGQDTVFHLSKNMYKKHISDTLIQIKEKLQKNEFVVVISTNLIEAGVDIDFRRVVRFCCGIPSIIQSAGRCNREGKFAPEDSIVYVIECEVDDELGLRRMSKTLDVEIEITKGIGSTKIISENYLLTYDNENRFCRPSMISLIDNEFYKEIKNNMCRTLGDTFRKFKAIEENNMVQVYYGCQEVITELKNDNVDFSKISKYSVDVSEKELQRFDIVGDFKIIQEYQYDKNFGLIKSEDEIMIV